MKCQWSTSCFLAGVAKSGMKTKSWREVRGNQSQVPWWRKPTEKFTISSMFLLSPASGAACPYREANKGRIDVSSWRGKSNTSKAHSRVGWTLRHNPNDIGDILEI